MSIADYKREQLKKELFHKLVTEDYSVNHLHHYTFIVNSERYVFGILEVLSFLGDDIFRRVRFAQEKESNIIPFPTPIKKSSVSV